MAQGSINNRYRLLIIGGSAGSLEVVVQLLPALKKNLDLAIVIVLHRKPGESVLSELLGTKTSWPVQEVEEKQKVERGGVFLAPADYHLLFEKDETFSLDFSEKVHYSRPSIDVSFESAAEVFGSAVIAVLLSGANADGTEGLKTIKASGGVTIVQDPADASVSFMPQQAIDHSRIDYIVPGKMIGDVVNRLAHP